MPHGSAPVDAPNRLRRFAVRYSGPVLGLGFSIAAFTALYHILRDYRWHDVRAAFQAIPPRHIAWAALLSLLGYATLSTYDILSLIHNRFNLSYLKTGFASFVGYALSNNVGVAWVSGSAIRYRLYTGWGLNAIEVARLVTFNWATGLLGLSLICAIGTLGAPGLLARALGVPDIAVTVAGIAFAVVPLGYALACLLRKRPLHVRDFDFSLPSIPILVLQASVGFIDYTIAAAVLYVLLPDSAGIGFWPFMPVFAAAIAAGMLSHVPGGLGVFDAVLVLLLAQEVPAPQVVGALLAYRALYYLVPLGLGVSLLAGYEVSRRRAPIQRAGAALSAALEPIVPRLYALAAMIAGALLMLSGATPPLRGRLADLEAYVPLPVIEVSHFAGSLIGLLLILVARGLQRRVDAAYWITCALLALGAVFAVLRKLGYEEAAILVVALLVLLPARRHFHRRASLIPHRLSPEWLSAAAAVIVATLWLGFFAYKHVEYRNDLWWQFSFESHAPRFLRAEVGVLAVGLAFGGAYLLRPRAPRPAPPSAEDLLAVARIVERSPDTYANLAFLGDKYFLFDGARTAFVMYAIEGDTWVAMGDPVGDPASRDELIYRFRELAERFGDRPAFYEVGAGGLHRYIDAGFGVVKLGERARVDVQAFTLEGAKRKTERNRIHKLERDGCVFRVVPRAEVPAWLPQLRALSDAWLKAKDAREKGFSLGRFDEDYLARYDHAVVECGGRLVAFGNLWQGAGPEELSLDLMRYAEDAPAGVMDFLFIKTMLWGREEGYRWFDLGMAPLAGMEPALSPSLWNRVAGLIYAHGEHFYNFQGLRGFKAKFDPVWEPMYLASPGGFGLPRIIANIATLIGGGASRTASSR